MGVSVKSCLRHAFTNKNDAPSYYDSWEFFVMKISKKKLNELRQILAVDSGHKYNNQQIFNIGHTLLAFFELLAKYNLKQDLTELISGLSL